MMGAQEQPNTLQRATSQLPLPVPRHEDLCGDLASVNHLHRSTVAWCLPHRTDYSTQNVMARLNIRAADWGKGRAVRRTTGHTQAKHVHVGRVEVRGTET